MAYEGVAILHRENKDLTIRIQNVDVHGILNGTSPDMALENNDILFVPNKSETLSERTIDVKGEVVYPGTYPFAENTNIQDILLQTGGLTEAGSMARVDVYRRIKNKEAVKEDVNISQSFTFSIDETYAICQDTTFYLQPYDVVIVRKSPSYETQQKVSVQGEINFKGEYTITNKNYRLSDLIKAGGGLTDFAFANGARLSRAMTAEEIEQQEMSNQIAQIQLYENSLKEGKDLNLEVAKTLYEIKTNKQKRYPVAINLQKALEQQGSNYDIVLRDGDIITIPTLSNTIKISGEVMSPVSLTYEEGKSLKYYIKHAGGYSENAARSRVYGIQANGSVVKLSSYSKSDIQPGTEIVVPQKQARRKLSTTEIIGIGSGIAALASVVVALLNVTK
jgi:protein involved in polysaccharide export with SLBB domain